MATAFRIVQNIPLDSAEETNKRTLYFLSLQFIAVYIRFSARNLTIAYVENWTSSVVYINYIVLYYFIIGLGCADLVIKLNTTHTP